MIEKYIHLEMYSLFAYSHWIPLNTLTLTLTALWADSTDDKLKWFFYIFLENKIWHLMQIVSLGGNLH